jgi:LysR family transcriptional regulator, transcriptional activator of the cysJI operon
VDLHRLRTFQALSETLHFRHAAERLGITQSAVSQQIASLEKDLGAPLFERIGRRVYLTPAGEVLAREAVKVLSTVSRAREAVGAVSKGDAGRLRVGASTTPGIYLLPEVLGRLRADFPLVELDFRIANSSRIEALAVANEFDLGVCGFRPTHEELFEVELGEDRIVPVAAPTLIGKTRRIRPGDLARWPLVAREAGSATRSAVERSLRSLGVELVPAFELPSPEAIVRAAEAGLGYAFVSARSAAEGIETGRLVEIRVQELDVRRSIFAVYHRDKQVTPPMRELIDLLRARLGRGDKRV